ncbi:hypothetical protein V6R94_06510 [Pediococcus acidilactici]
MIFGRKESNPCGIPEKIHAQKASEETSANEDSKNESRLRTSREQRFSTDEIAEEKVAL